MPLNKPAATSRVPSRAETVARNPHSGAPVPPRRPECKKIERPMPSYFKKFAQQTDEEGNPVRGLIRKDFSPLPPSESDKNNPFLKEYDASERTAKSANGLRLVSSRDEVGNDDASEKPDFSEAREQARRNAQDRASGMAEPKKRKSVLPQPKVLMEDDETLYKRAMGLEEPESEQSGEGHKAPRRLEIPDVSEDPEVLAAQEAARKAQHDLEKLEARKKMMAMIARDETPDPDKVAELCGKEPWKKGDLMELSVSLFGFVPNKFEFMRDRCEQGSADYERYDEAYKQACAIYNDQITQAATAQFNKVANKQSDPVTVRAKMETINARLNAFRKQAGMEGHKLLSYQGGMLMRAMIVMGHLAMNNNGGHTWGKGTLADGRRYEKFSLKPGGEIKPGGLDPK